MLSGWPLAVVGVVLLTALLVDVVGTTMGQGAGFLTRRFTAALWRVLLSPRLGRKRHRLLYYGGVAIVLSTLVFWVLLLWAGWSAIFLSGPEGVVDSQTQVPADVWERFYFTGFTIFTLGTGDFRPEGDSWRVLTAIASGSGLFVITFSITYLVPVVQAGAFTRQLGTWLSALGPSPEHIVCSAWDGEKLAGLASRLDTLSQELAKLEQQYLTYPVLHYLHSRKPSESAALGVVALDEALTLIHFAVKVDQPELDQSVMLTRRVIENLLATLHDVFFTKEAEPPNAPSVDVLRRAGIPVVSDAEFAEVLEGLAPRRCLLHGLVDSDGRSWKDLRSGRHSTPERFQDES